MLLRQSVFEYFGDTQIIIAHVSVQPILVDFTLSRGQA